MNIKNLQKMYNTALELRAPWLKRWDEARRYTIPTSDTEVATLFDGTASDAVDNLSTSIYTSLKTTE